MSQTSTDWAKLRSRSVVLTTPTGKSKGVPGGGLKSPPVSVTMSSPTVSDVRVSVLFVSFGAGSDVCGGRVGVDNTKFCTLPCVAGSTSCRFATHDRKANIVGSSFYICTSKSGVAFMQPRVVEPPGGFSQMIKNAMEDFKTMNAWNVLFQC